MVVYSGVLRTALSTALFSYSTITHLPSGHQQIVWSIDASVPLFEFNFSILFVSCILLLLLQRHINLPMLLCVSGYSTRLTRAKYFIKQ